MTAPTRVLILGAAGRDFHNFNVCYRADPQVRVVAFTATQIPNIAGRRYPPELAGPLYPDGIPIYPETELPQLIARLNVDQVVFAYSDVSHEHVMHLASTALAGGADFVLLGPRRTSLTSSRPVVSIGAARTGSGKSPATRWVVGAIRRAGVTPVVLRHPMPYGDLAAQACQRFATFEDLDRHHCTIEEREEYEPHLAAGTVVYAGVDYERILRQAEAEADVIVWDGGNNDLPFIVPDLHLVVVDPHRAGHERSYHPGEANVRMADVVIISKVDTAAPEAVRTVRATVAALNPDAEVTEAALAIRVDDEGLVAGRRALVVEDGPTLTHGEMSYGAGVLLARRLGATLVDPRPFAAPSIAAVFAQYPHLGPVLPAMGYGGEQLADLATTIEATPCDVVVCATPVDLRRLIPQRRPMARVTYELEPRDEGTLVRRLNEVIRRAPGAGARGKGA
ncbi:MAG: cyclic 2,3-diphosphoglycerate synthase [Armatimonadota bacterium]|nr:cyclic 2,3-diphosphoglycerate synthase [Armatimonadota bacterium]